MVSAAVVPWLLACALAQEAIDAHGFTLADGRGDPGTPIGFLVPGEESEGAGWAGGVVEYANRPFQHEGTVHLDNLVALDLAGGFAVLDDVRLGVSFPLYLTSTDVAGRIQPAWIGDVRVHGVYTALSGADWDLGVAAVGVIPSGNEDDLLGLPGPGAELAAVGRAGLGSVIVSGALGAAGDLTGDVSGVVRVATAAELIADVVTGVEVGARIPVMATASLGIPVEALVTARGQQSNGSNWMVGLGASPSTGPGAARLRVVVGGGFGMKSEPSVDAMLAESETKDEEDAEPESPRAVVNLSVEPAEAVAEVWLDHPVCRWVPLSDAAPLLSELAPGTEVLVQAPGYLPRHAPVDGGPIQLEPAPSQGGVVVLAKPSDQVRIGGVELPAASDGVFLANLPEGSHSVQVAGGGRVWRTTAATMSGYAVWIRVPDLRPMEVYFDAGQAALRSDALASLASLARNSGGLVYEVRGSYSRDGSMRANLALANRRARAVASELVRAGLPRSRVLVRDPLAPKGGGASSAEQRRVSVIPVGAN